MGVGWEREREREAVREWQSTNEQMPKQTTAAYLFIVQPVCNILCCLPPYPSDLCEGDGGEERGKMVGEGDGIEDEGLKWQVSQTSTRHEMDAGVMNVVERDDANTKCWESVGRQKNQKAAVTKWIQTGERQ